MNCKPLYIIIWYKYVLLHFDNLLGDVGEFAPPSEDVEEAFEFAGWVGLGREDGGGAREGAGPGGANICDEM